MNDEQVRTKLEAIAAELSQLSEDSWHLFDASVRPDFPPQYEFVNDVNPDVILRVDYSPTELGSSARIVSRNWDVWLDPSHSQDLSDFYYTSSMGWTERISLEGDAKLLAQHLQQKFQGYRGEFEKIKASFLRWSTNQGEAEAILNELRQALGLKTLKSSKRPIKFRRSETRSYQIEDAPQQLELVRVWPDWDRTRERSKPTTVSLSFKGLHPDQAIAILQTFQSSENTPIAA